MKVPAYSDSHLQRPCWAGCEGRRGEQEPLRHQSPWWAGMLKSQLPERGQERVVTGQGGNGSTLKESELRLDIREKSSAARVLKLWHKIAVAAPSLDGQTVFKARLDGTLSNLV